MPEDKYLLDDNVIKIDNKNVNSKEIKSYVRPKPNKKLLGFRFYLRVYNLSKPNKYNWFNRWLKTIGFEPVIYDPYLVDKSTKQIKQYLSNKGYYYSEIKDTVIVKNDKATVTYNVKTGKPYKIANLKYAIPDTAVLNLIKSDTTESDLKIGTNFDTDNLQKERARVDQLLKRNGYYGFSQNYIKFVADTSKLKLETDITLQIGSPKVELPGGKFKEVPHPIYQIHDIYYYIDFNPQIALKDTNYINSFDTLLLGDIHFLYKNKLRLKPEILAQTNYIEFDKLYNYDKVQETYKALGSLRLFKYSNIEFYHINQQKRNAMSELFESEFEEEKKDSITNYYLDTKIFLTFLKDQSTSFELEGTNSGGDFGVAGNLLYRHNNLFRGAEIFDLKLRGQNELITREDNLTKEIVVKSATELGAEASIRTPKFILPFKATQFIKKNQPYTQFLMAYNFQERPEYKRDLMNASFGYIWKGSETTTHNIKPLELNKINISDVDTSENGFFRSIEGTPLESSYSTHSILNANYSFTYNNQNISKASDYTFVRMKFETAGLLLTEFNDLIKADKVLGKYQLLSTNYAQYIIGDMDSRYTHILNESNSVVYRFYAGLGIPFGNSEALPSEKRFFAGGANGIRGWQVRALGPGSYTETDTINFPNYTGDIKIEANFEYRFKIFSILEGALFVDAGNIWDLRETEGREGAQFKLTKFYNDFALSTGAGLRANLSFFVFRVDVGLKMRDPSIEEVSKWILANRSLNFKNDVQMHLTIGYPF